MLLVFEMYAIFCSSIWEDLGLEVVIVEPVDDFVKLYEYLSSGMLHEGCQSFEQVNRIRQ